MLHKKGGYAELMIVGPDEYKVQTTSTTTTAAGDRNEGSMLVTSTSTNSGRNEGSMVVMQQLSEPIAYPDVTPSWPSLQRNSVCCLHIPGHKFAYKFSKRDAYLLIVCFPSR